MTRQDKTYKIKLKVKLASARHGGQELRRTSPLFFYVSSLAVPQICDVRW